LSFKVLLNSTPSSVRIMTIWSLEAITVASRASSISGWSFIILLNFFLPRTYTYYDAPLSGGGVAPVRIYSVRLYIPGYAYSDT
jgi:putative flippase GtrA